MNAYFDTSALVKLVLDEPGSGAAAACWMGADDGFAVNVGYVELRAALDGARRGGRPAHPESGMDAVFADDLWEQLAEVDIDASVMATAVRISIERGLRALDAIHVAAGLMAAGDEPLAFVSFDHRQRLAAAAEGLVILPAELP